MYKVGDYVDIPMTCSNNPVYANNLRTTSINRNIDKVKIVSIQNNNNVVSYTLGFDDSLVSYEGFTSSDLNRYGHANLVVAQLIDGDRVKCKCGKTHTHGSYNAIVLIDDNVCKVTKDSSGWFVKMFKKPFTKPRGSREYTKYVAYCPECERQMLAESRENERLYYSSDIANPPVTITSTTVTIEPPRIAIANDVIPHMTRTPVRATPEVLDNMATVVRQPEPVPNIRQKLKTPFSIFKHHKGGI